MSSGVRVRSTQWEEIASQDGRGGRAVLAPFPPRPALSVGVTTTLVEAAAVSFFICHSTHMSYLQSKHTCRARRQKEEKQASSRHAPVVSPRREELSCGYQLSLAVD